MQRAAIVHLSFNVIGTVVWLMVYSVLSDLLTDMERTSDHCSNIAVSIMDAHAYNMNAHQSLRRLKEGNPAFYEKLDDYSSVKNGDFFKIGIPFTLAAIVPAYILIWILFGV